MDAFQSLVPASVLVEWHAQPGFKVRDMQGLLECGGICCDKDEKPIKSVNKTVTWSNSLASTRPFSLSSFAISGGSTLISNSSERDFSAAITAVRLRIRLVFSKVS